MELLKDKWLWLVAGLTGFGLYMVYKKDREDNPVFIDMDDLNPLGSPLTRSEFDRIVDSSNDFEYGDIDEDEY